MHATSVDASAARVDVNAAARISRTPQGRGHICSSGTTVVHRTKRKLRRSTSSQHFPDPVGTTTTTAAVVKATTPSKRAGVKWRSGYFASSPDSCAGSAASFDWGSAFTEQAVNAFRSCPKFGIDGVRHLCKRLCYLRAYEPCRKWHALRSAVAKAGAPTRVLDNWSVRMDGGEGPEHPWRISYLSPDGSVFPSAKPALASLGLASCGGDRPASPCRVRRKHRSPPRTPRPSAFAATCPRPTCACGPAYLLKEAPKGAFPPSPFGLIEELLTDDPWKMLLGCIMLNQTTRSQMDPVLVRFLEKFPTAAATAAATVDEVARVAGPLGLQERRPVAIIRFSQEYLRMTWESPEELYWVGPYAADAYKIFIERKWHDVQPNDHALNWWVEWMRGTQTEKARATEPSALLLDAETDEGSGN